MLTLCSNNSDHPSCETAVHVHRQWLGEIRSARQLTLSSYLVFPGISSARPLSVLAAEATQRDFLVGKENTQKTELPEVFHLRRSREFEIWGPSLIPEKNEFGIGEDVISRYLEWIRLTCTLQSLLSYQIKSNLLKAEGPSWSLTLP